MSTVIYDIEANGLLEGVSVVHCAWCYEVETDKYVGFDPDNIQDLPDYLNTFDFVAGHNIIGYDNPAILKVLGKEITSTAYDTLVAARLYKPDITGGHSLDMWGRRLGLKKGSVTGEEEEVTDDVWEVFTPEMYEYCKQDVKVTAKLFDMLVEKGYHPELVVFDMELLI
jgi:hypothetical protein|tara:strand:+ start:722 stop:1228 length:507 start_codon:yes stop_codon:yes gene_type:complete